MRGRVSACCLEGVRPRLPTAALTSSQEDVLAPGVAALRNHEEEGVAALDGVRALVGVEDTEETGLPIQPG